MSEEKKNGRASNREHQTSRNLCIIPARGGSKRIPRKNIKMFLGKPIIAYSIETALQSGIFDEVMVSTDDEDIAQIAKNHGAGVPFLRSEPNANDMATTIDVINEVVEQYQSKGRTFELVCCLYPTAPFVKREHLTQGLELLQKKNSDTVYPVAPFSFPIWRGVKLDADNKSSMIWPEHANTRSQDLEPVYHDAGQWYWLKSGKKLKSVITQNSASVVLDEMYVQDIDTPTDWKMAELKFKLQNEELL